ncbi:MAG: sulfatase [Gemmatimonadota bacterium]
MSVQAERRSSVSPKSILVLALWTGMVTGLLEALILAIRSYGLGHLVHVSWYFPWMAPAADAILFLLPALPLAIIARIFPRAVPFRLVVFLMSTMSLGALLLMYPKVMPYASVLLAAGIGFQISRTLTRHRSGFQNMAGRSTWVLMALVVLLAVGMSGFKRLREGRALSHLGPVESGRRNVLLIILDTVRAANLSLYGYDRPTTPNLESLARRGVRFDQAFSAAPWTLPSHASLLTGRWPHELSADWESPLDNRQLTLAEYFDGQGYATGGFVANVGYCSWEFGLDRGFSHYQDFLVNWRSILASSSIGRQMDRSYLLRGIIRSDQHLVRIAAPDINRGFLHWVDGRDGRPFFAMLNYYDAHGPYLPPPPFDRKFSPEGRNADLSALHRYLARPARAGLGPDVVAREMAQYDGALAYLDQELGALFQSLETRGLLANTIIVVTADHGEEFGEHGVFDHGNSLYSPAVHVPLVVVAPGLVPPGRSVSQAASLRNVARTLTHLSGMRDTAAFPGFSLARFWTDSLAPAQPLLSEVSQGIRTPAWYPVSQGDMKAVVADSLRYIRNGDGSVELYRTADDPFEQANLASSTEMNGRLRVLEDVLAVLTTKE